MLDGVAPEKSAITIEVLRASQALVLLESANNSVSAPGTRAGSHSATSGRYSRTQGDASTQATEKEIDTFTEATLNQSWILPNVSAQARGSSRRSRKEKDKKALTASDFEPVKIKTIVPRKYQDAGTTGSPSQPVPLTFVPYQSSAGSQLSADFSSFDFSLNDTLSSPAKPASVKEPRSAKPKASKAASPMLHEDTEQRAVSSAPRSHSPAAGAATTAAAERRSRPSSPPEVPIFDDFKPINTKRRSTGKVKASNNSTAKSSKSEPQTSPGPNKSSNDKSKSSSLFSPVAAPNGSRAGTPGNHNRPASPGMVFFPTLLGSPSAPILTFKPVGMIDDDFGF
jgi:hypothetical protein